jgi:hypothetical protein
VLPVASQLTAPAQPQTKHSEEADEASEPQDEETPLGIGFALDDKFYFLPLQEKQGTRTSIPSRVSIYLFIIF